MYMSVRMSIHVSMHMPMHMFMHIFIHMSIRMSIHPSTCLYTCLYACLYTCLHTCLDMSLNRVQTVSIHILTHRSARQRAVPCGCCACGCCGSFTECCREHAGALSRRRQCARRGTGSSARCQCSWTAGGIARMFARTAPHRTALHRIALHRVASRRTHVHTPACAHVRAAGVGAQQHGKWDGSSDAETAV